MLTSSNECNQLLIELRIIAFVTILNRHYNIHYGCLYIQCYDCSRNLLSIFKLVNRLINAPMGTMIPLSHQTPKLDKFRKTLFDLSYPVSVFWKDNRSSFISGKTVGNELLPFINVFQRDSWQKMLQSEFNFNYISSASLLLNLTISTHSRQHRTPWFLVF